MKDLIIWLERQIEICNELGNMEGEKYAFAHTLKKVRKEAINFTDSSLQLESLKVNRFEIIDKNGRSYTNWIKKHFKIKTSLQDNDRTLKIFLYD